MLLDEYDGKGKLACRGRVGAGFGEDTFRTLMPRLEKLAR